MPGKVKVKIIAGRNLPVMDRSSDTTDAYVEIKLGNTTYKTDVCRKSLNPQWNSEWYRFEVDDSELQDEPLQIRLMDHDTYSANDAIGKVYLNLNPLLIPAVALPGKYGWGGEANVDQPSSSVMSGWIPVYDTMHGIRGEVNVTVKVELFSDFNKFRQSSCGLQFFCSPVIPHGYHAQVIHGFIEELVVNDDPEYQWIDKIRTPRASNEARQTLFFKLSGELQRKIGVKALDLGGNAVIGYNQCFDLEGESGIVARGIGTVVTLVKHHDMQQQQQQLDIGIAEEKALSYLKFLAFDNGLKLDNHNIFERFTLSHPIPNTSIFVNTPDPKESNRMSTRRNIPLFLRTSSQPLIEYEPLPSNLKTSISTRSLSDDLKEEIALRQLLRQEEMKGSSSIGLSRKIKCLKQNMMSKKKKIDESLDLDSASISSRGESSNIRTSLIDLRELRKKKKQNSAMAELLVRSVMHVHTSLDCIVECHDSGLPLSSSTSILNEEIEESSSPIIESQNTIIEIVPVTGLNKTISEPYLLLPDSTMVTPTSNASSESELSSSDGSDSPSEIKDDKIEFDTVSFIVKNVQYEEKLEHKKHEYEKASQEFDFSCLNPAREIENIETPSIVVVPINGHISAQTSVTAPVLESDNRNLFTFPNDFEKKMEQLSHSAMFDSTNKIHSRKKGHLSRALSRSCTDISAANETEANIEKNNEESIILPAHLKKKIENLRFSALFKSIAERPNTKLNKTFSISCEDISTNNTEAKTTTENIAPPNLTEPNKKRRMNKAFSISCEEIYSPKIEEIEKRIEKLRGSALFTSLNKKPEPRKRGKLTRTFSISCDDMDQENDNNEQNTVLLPANIDKKIEKLFQSPLFTDTTGNLEPRRGKLSKALSRSCIDIFSTDKSDVNTDHKKLQSTKNIEQRIEMFKNSPLFKISIIAKPKGEMNRDLSRSHTDLTSTDKCDLNRENNSISNPDLSKAGLVQNAIHAMLTEKINLLTSRPAPISPRASEQLLPQGNSDLRKNSLLQTAMQTILMEKIDLMTAQQAPVSKRVKEEFQKSVAKSLSTSDPDIKSSGNKIHLFPIKSPSFLRKSRADGRLGSLKHTPSKSDLDLRDQISVRSLLFDKIHRLTSKSPSLSRKFNGEHKNGRSEPQSPTHSGAINGNSLTKTAMETMLMEKVNILTPPISSHGDNEFIYTNQENVSCAQQFDSSSKSFDQHYTSKQPENDSLFKSAMQTMLLDKVNVIAPNSPAISTTTEDEPNFNASKSSKHPNLDKIKTTVHTVLDKVHILSPKSTDKKFFNESEPSLMRTAMQTMLIDKVNIIAPEVAPLAEEESVSDDIKPPSPKRELPKLDKVKSAVHTVLDKVSNLSPISPTSPKNDKKFDFNKDESDPSLMKTAMQAMLIDKVNILTPDAQAAVEEIDDSQPPTKHEVKHEHLNLDKVKSAVHTVLDKVHNLSSPIKDKKFDFGNDDEGNESLTKTAMQTMLLDKVNIIVPGSPTSVEPKEYHSGHKSQHVSHEKENAQNYDHVQNESLMQTAMQTMLMDNLNLVTSKSATMSEQPMSSDSQLSSKSDSGKKSSIFSSIKKKCISLKSKMKFHKDTPKTKVKEEGLVESAMSTILMDRVNSIQGTLSSTDDEMQQPQSENPPSSSPINIETQQKISVNTSSSTPVPIELQPLSPPKAYIKENLDDITLTSTCTKEPNITIRPDTGVSCNRTKAADDANCNTNAEHVPCLYTSDRRIVESPVPERAAERERDRDRDRERERDREFVRDSRERCSERHGHQRTESTGGKMSQSPARLNAIPCIHRRSSDSDLSITPKGNSLTGSDRSGGGNIPGYHHIRSTLLRPTVDNFDMMEYPFLTMAKYPPGFVLHLGGAVSARSVKLLERITNIEEPETRDTWWSEIRMEIRTHARALNCNAVLGYTESTSICDEVCVLSASGTAAVIALYSGELSDGVSGLPNLHKPHVPNKDLMTSSLDRTDFEREKNNSKNPEPSTSTSNNKIPQVAESPEQEPTIEFSGSATAQTQPTACRICHIPYSESTMSFRINMLYCSVCKMAKVPDILLTTIEMPEGLPITGRGCFLQSYVCRPKRDLKGELNAKEISESLPFLEYELHRLLVNKMKVKAMNTIFGLKVRITIGERMLIGIATGTAVFLMPLPPPPLPKLIAGNATTEDKRLAEMQKLLVDTVKKNKEIYELKDVDIVQPSDNEESDEEKSNIDLAAGNKDSCVLEVDDSEDIEVINLLVEPRPPDGFHVVNTENVPGLEELEIVKNLQMFTQVWRAKIPLNQSASHFGKHFQKLLQSVYFKLRRMIPCALCDLQFRVDLPEPDEIQLTLLGMALGLGDPMKLNKFKRKTLCHLPAKELNKKTGPDDELIFNLEDDFIPENSIPVISQGTLLNPQMPKHRQKSPQRLTRLGTKQRHTPIKERHGVDITPLSYVPGGKIERYLGYLNFFFIRETTSIREGGGLSGFVHSFITEVLAIVRAHVTALGGNAMVSYFMTEYVLYHNAHKNQGQCLINVGGDVVFVSYFAEDN